MAGFQAPEVLEELLTIPKSVNTIKEPVEEATNIFFMFTNYRT